MPSWKSACACLKNQTGIAGVDEERLLLRRQIAMLQEEQFKVAAELAAALGKSKARGHATPLRGDEAVGMCRAELAIVERQLTTAREAMSAFNNAELELVQLERELQLEKAGFNKNAENRELARIDKAMQDHSISNLNVLQTPSYSITPSKPRVIVNMALGFVLALISCCGVVGLAEIRRGGSGLADDPLARTSWDADSALPPMMVGNDPPNIGNGHGHVEICSSESDLRHAPR